MKERRRERVHRWWRKFSDYAIVLILLAALGGLAFGIYNGWVAKNNSAQALDYAQEAKEAAQQLKTYTIHAHNNNVASQKQIETLEHVIISQNQEIINDHAESVQLQKELQATVNQIGPELVQGQAQINAYLGYLTCLVTHGDDDGSNVAACGSPPPLPPTN